LVMALAHLSLKLLAVSRYDFDEALAPFMITYLLMIVGVAMYLAMTRQFSRGYARP